MVAHLRDGVDDGVASLVPKALERIEGNDLDQSTMHFSDRSARPRAT
jgi:hypothetical protein